ncbi:MAG: hypothetical protein KatS3mg116_2789 [Elioraea sp.]|nr:MAG: hypothetical protein KatS3mg116_2789 [Elioraea sp.]
MRSLPCIFCRVQRPPAFLKAIAAAAVLSRSPAAGAVSRTP